VDALKGLARESGSAVTYRSTKEEAEKKFEEIGKLMYVLVKPFKGLVGQGAYDTLKRVFEEQYQVEQAEGEKKTVAAPLDTEKAGAKSLESPYGGEAGDRAGQGEAEDKEDAAEKAEAGEHGDTEAMKNAEAGEQAEIVPRETKEIDAKSVQRLRICLFCRCGFSVCHPPYHNANNERLCYEQGSAVLKRWNRNIRHNVLVKRIGNAEATHFSLPGNFMIGRRQRSEKRTAAMRPIPCKLPKEPRQSEFLHIYAKIHQSPTGS
jgi:hypothetical protein